MNRTSSTNMQRKAQKCHLIAIISTREARKALECLYRLLSAKVMGQKKLEALSEMLHFSGRLLPVFCRAVNGCWRREHVVGSYMSLISKPAQQAYEWEVRSRYYRFPSLYFSKYALLKNILFRTVCSPPRRKEVDLRYMRRNGQEPLYNEAKVCLI